MRRLARLYLIKSNNERLFLQTRLASMIHRYMKLRRAKRKLAATTRWRKFANMMLEREKKPTGSKRQRPAAYGPKARWLELVRTILENDGNRKASSKVRRGGKKTIDHWRTLVTGLRGNNPDLFSSLAIQSLKVAKPGSHGMAAQIRLAALARKYVRYAEKRHKLRMTGKLGKLFNRYIEYRHERDHSTYGFCCLHHTCSEGCGTLEVFIKNKRGNPGSVRVRTVDGGAKAGGDYTAVDKVIRFSRGDEFGSIEVPIIDDDGFEDDEDFFIELLDSKTGKPLYCADTRTRVTIIDDDRPAEGEFKMSMKVFARWARLIRGVGSVRKKNVLTAYGRLIGLVSRYVKYCHRRSDGFLSKAAPRTGDLSIPMRF